MKHFALAAVAALFPFSQSAYAAQVIDFDPTPAEVTESYDENAVTDDDLDVSARLQRRVVAVAAPDTFKWEYTYGHTYTVESNDDVDLFVVLYFGNVAAGRITNFVFYLTNNGAEITGTRQTVADLQYTAAARTLSPFAGNEEDLLGSLENKVVTGFVMTFAVSPQLDITGVDVELEAFDIEQSN